MDKITIKNLKAFAFHGVLNEEKQNGQEFFISLEIELISPPQNDELASTINYDELCNNIASEFQSNQFDLIESCANHLAFFILDNYSLAKSVEVEVKKPHAPLKQTVEYVSSSVKRQRSIAYIGLGSNIDRESNMHQAIELLKTTRGIKLLDISSQILTKPVGYKNQDDFLNAVAKIETIFSPYQLLFALNKIEQSLGRKRTIKNGPRTIDLDILLFEGVTLNDSRLTIPHPRMLEREFVLFPLKEIAPNIKI